MGSSPLLTIDPTGEADALGVLPGLAVIGAISAGVVCHINHYGDEIIPATAEALDIIIKGMDKGGKQNIDNKYVRDGQNNCRNQDPCKYLRDLYSKETNPKNRLKIKQAMKRYDCDGKGRFKCLG